MEWKIKIIVKRKSVSIMGDYKALHWLVPNNELPHRLRNGKIPKNEVWIREDLYDDRIMKNITMIHEKTELNYMINKGYKYKRAHALAEVADGMV